MMCDIILFATYWNQIPIEAMRLHCSALTSLAALPHLFSCPSKLDVIECISIQNFNLFCVIAWPYQYHFYVTSILVYASFELNWWIELYAWYDAVNQFQQRVSHTTSSISTTREYKPRMEIWMRCALTVRTPCYH